MSHDNVRSGLIYAVRNDHDGRIKLGFTTNLPRRLRALQTGSSGGPLRVVAVLRGSPYEEKFVHTYFKERRVHRPLFEECRGDFFRNTKGGTEWFDDTDQYISTVLTAAEKLARGCWFHSVWLLKADFGPDWQPDLADPVNRLVFRDPDDEKETP